MVRCLVGFGSNAGDLHWWFEQTVGLLRGHPAIKQLRYSRPVKTKAVLGESAILGESAVDDADDSSAASEYLNSVISLETSLSAEQLFELTKKIETDLGRVRSQRWAARTVDLDILLFGDEVIETQHLTVPHPRMSFRRFVLEGAVEIASEMVHPQSCVTIQSLWDRICSGPRQILWACAPEKFDEAAHIRDELTKNSSGPFFLGPKKEAAGAECWEIVIWELSSVEALEQHKKLPDRYSLLLYSGETQGHHDTARWFGGPVLNLIDCSSDFLKREVVAAVEAML